MAECDRFGAAAVLCIQHAPANQEEVEAAWKGSVGASGAAGVVDGRIPNQLGQPMLCDVHCLAILSNAHDCKSD